MRSKTDLNISSQALNILNGQKSQEAPCDHAVPSTSSSTAFPIPASDVPFGLSAFSSHEKDKEKRLSGLSSTAGTGRKSTHRLSRPSEDDSKKRYTKNVIPRPQGCTPILSKRHELRKGKEKNHRKFRSDHVEKARVAKVSKLEKTRQGAAHIDTVLLDNIYQGESPSHSTSALGHAERISPRLMEDRSQHIRSSDTIGVDLPFVSDSRATGVPQSVPLPTPPISDTGSDHIKWREGGESNKSDGVSSYRFLPVPQRPPENTTFSTIRSHSLPELHSIQRRIPPATKRPFLDLIWRDIGNGISRAYRRHDLPPPPALELPTALSTLIEGLHHFIKSDGDTTITQEYSNEGTDVDNTTEDNDWLVFDDNDLQIPSDAPTSHREPFGALSSDSETDTDIILSTLNFKAGSLPTYSFIATPQITTLHLNYTPEVDDFNTVLDSRIHTNHDPDPDGEIPSHVQPDHLTPHRIVRPSIDPIQSLKIEQYSPSTSTGFSDTDTDTEARNSKPPHIQSLGSRATAHAYKKRMRKRRHRYKQQRQLGATTTSAYPDTHSFTRVAVLRAAERLHNLLDQKRFCTASLSPV